MKMGNRRLVWIAPLLLLLAGVAGCGDDDDENQTPPPPVPEPEVTIDVSGTVVDGPVNGATVIAYAVDARGIDGAQLATATTAADGSFTLELTEAPAAGIRIRSSGGTYTSEADIAVTHEGSELSVLLDAVPEAGLTGIAITPLTTIVDRRTSTLLGLAPASAGHKALGDSSDQAESEVKSFYGFAPDAPKFSSLTPNFFGGSGHAAKLGLVIGAFQELGSRVGRSPGAVVHATAEDLSDGEPDGRKSEEPIFFGDGDPAPSTLTTSDFLGALSSYIDPSNTSTILAQNEVELEEELIEEVRAAVVEAAPPSVALQIGSSGAVTVISSAGKQIVYVAARSQGIKAVDMTDPANPVLLPLDDLNAALAGLETPLTDVGGVVAVPGAATPQVILYSYLEPYVVLADVQNEAILAAVDLSEALTTITSFSGGSAYISSGIPDPTRGVVWLATGDGYYPFNYTSHELEAPIPLVNGQIVAENIGGDIGSDMLFSPNYGAGSGGGLQLVNLVERKAYSLDDDQFQSLFAVPSDASSFPFGIADGGAVDSVLNVGVVTGEDTPYIGFLDMSDLSQFSFDAENSSFSVVGEGLSAVIDSADDSGYPVISGAAIDSQTHLALFMAGYSSTVMVGQLDDPADPAGDSWVGMTDWAFYDASFSEYDYARDPHAVGVVQALADGRSYGFLLSDGQAILMIDMAAFLAAPRAETGRHLAATPFDGSIIKSIALGTPSSFTRSPPPAASQRGYGVSYPGNR